MSPIQTALDTIPPPEIVRERLAHTLRAAAILRRQLTLSERAAEERRQREPAQAGGTSHAA